MLIDEMALKHQCYRWYHTCRLSFRYCKPPNHALRWWMRYHSCWYLPARSHRQHYKWPRIKALVSQYLFSFIKNSNFTFSISQIFIKPNYHQSSCHQHPRQERMLLQARIQQPVLATPNPRCSIKTAPLENNLQVFSCVCSFSRCVMHF